MCNSAEHEFCPANESQITFICKFFLAKLAEHKNSVLINMKMPTVHIYKQKKKFSAEFEHEIVL